MLPDPLHPAVVHFPIVLMFLLPVVALASLWRIRRGASPVRAWGVAVAVAAALSLSAWAAVQTGESQMERVEEATAEAPLESHEEMAERFLILSAVLLGLTGAGLLGGRLGAVAQGASTAGALAILAAGIPVGHSGGQLVYRYGAASVYATGPAASADGSEGSGPHTGGRETGDRD